MEHGKNPGARVLAAIESPAAASERGPRAAVPSTSPLPLYAAALAASGALLFAVEPLVGRLALPLLGGGPSVWTTCMLFFQGMLLLGYLYADRVSRLPPATQRLLHLGVLIAGLAALPVRVARGDPTAVPTDEPTTWLIAALTANLGLPYLALAANTPLLQSWLGASPGRPSPYVLYAASNAGSLFGLLAYPFWVEPRLPLAAQARLWSVGYTLLCLLVLACAVAVRPSTGSGSGTPRVRWSRDAIAWRRRALWFVLGLVPSCLLLGSTTWISTDLAPVPLLWTLPLALYLGSFVVVFAPRPLRPSPTAGRVLCLLSVCVLVGIWTDSAHTLWLAVPLHLALLALACFVCHGRLAEDAPPPEHLTEYFLCLTAGGAAGGAASALVAPLVFDSIAEYPLAIIAACALAPRAAARMPDSRSSDFLYATAVAAAALMLGWITQSKWPGSPLASVVTFLPPALLAYRWVLRPARFALALLGLTLVSARLPTGNGERLIAERNFFGVARVTLDRQAGFLNLVHGTTLHGRESLGGRCAATAYYHPRGPLGDVMRAWRQSDAPRRVGIVGLGVGASLAYARPEDAWTFYEIDPGIIAIARHEFSFLDRCDYPPPRIVVGDARRRLAEEPAEPRLGLLVLDAFSSDAIPVHLLTREAFELYRARLAPAGILAVHASNTYLDLAPLVAAEARAVGLAVVARADHEIDRRIGKDASLWIALGRRGGVIDRVAAMPHWRVAAASPRTLPWTDEASNLLGLVRWQVLLPWR